MKMQKKVTVDGAYAKKEPYNYENKEYEADIKNGDKVKILSAGEYVTGQFGDQFVIKIETRNGEKNYPLNQSSINILIDNFGEDSEDWVGKEVKVLTKKGMFAGKKGIASYLVSDEWSLDEYGDLTKDEKTSDEEPPAPAPEDIPF